MLPIYVVSIMFKKIIRILFLLGWSGEAVIRQRGLIKNINRISLPNLFFIVFAEDFLFRNILINKIGNIPTGVLSTLLHRPKTIKQFLKQIIVQLTLNNISLKNSFFTCLVVHYMYDVLTIIRMIGEKNE